MANTEDCHGGSKNSPTGFNANQPNQLLGTAIKETEVGYEMVNTGLDMTTGVVVHNSVPRFICRPAEVKCRVTVVWKS